MSRSFLLKVAIMLLVAGSYTANAQNHSYIFSHLKETDGLSYNIINCFLKDSRGILWVGTFDGLSRYDGSHFYNFKRTKDAGSLPHHTIHDLCEDQEGRIWGATDNGIFVYSVIDNKFKHYSTPNSKGATPVQNIICDRQGNIWATGIWTVLRYNSKSDVFEEIEPLTTHKDSLTDYSVRKNGLLEDPAGKGLWLATRSGLHFYNTNENKYSGYRNQPGSELFTHRGVAALAASPKGFFWLFDNETKHIIGFDPLTGKIIHRISLEQQMSAAAGATIFEDSNGMLWFSSWNHGMLVIDYMNGNKVIPIKHEESNTLSIAAGFFWCAFEDEDETIWLGTSGGISRCNATKSLYKIHRFSSLIPELNTKGSIVSIAEDPADKSLWLGTLIPSVVHYYPSTGKYEFYDLSTAQSNRNHSLPGVIGAIRFIDGRPVVCTQRGSWMLNGVGEIVPFNPLPLEYQSFLISSFIQKKEIFYFANEDKMLRWNRLTNEVTSVENSRPILDNGQKSMINYLVQKADSKLWMVAGLGWLAGMQEENKITPVYILSDIEKEQSGYFTSLDIDETGNLWAVNRGEGLYKYDPVLKIAKNWDETDGLVSNNIFSAIADGKGQVWCVSNNKFSVFTIKTERFYNFTIPLSQNNPGYISSTVVLGNGNILTNIYNDVIEFFPVRLAYKPFPRKPVISLINISGRDKLMGTEEELSLEPFENSIAIKFGFLTDPEIFPYSLDYMLEGFDKKWIKARSTNEAVYNNLPPGTYYFRLIARANDSSWQSEEKKLKLVIRTPFFKSRIFFILLFLVAGSLLYAFYRFRMGKQRQVHELQNKAYSLEKEKALVMYEGLKQQLNPHFLFNSLTSLNSLIDSDPKNASRFLDSLSKTYRYILKSSDNETVSLTDEIKFAEAYISLQKTRFEKGFDVTISVPREYYHRMIVPVTLQNLVENAIKHNIIDEERPLLIEITVIDDYLVVKNNKQLKNFVEASNRQGLTNLQALYHYLSNRKLKIIGEDQFFTIWVPLL